MAKSVLKSVGASKQPPAEYRIRKECRSVFWHGGRPHRAGDMIFADAELLAEHPDIIERIAHKQNTEPETLSAPLRQEQQQ